MNQYINPLYNAMQGDVSPVFSAHWFSIHVNQDSKVEAVDFLKYKPSFKMKQLDVDVSPCASVINFYLNLLLQCLAQVL